MVIKAQRLFYSQVLFAEITLRILKSENQMCTLCSVAFHRETFKMAHLYPIPSFARTKYHRLGGLTSSDSSSNNSGNWKPETKESMGLFCPKDFPLVLQMTYLSVFSYRLVPDVPFS